MLTVSPSGFGKTSVILAAADALFDHMDYWAIFSKSHMLDPAWQELIARIRALYRQRRIDESEPPFLFENMDHLSKVLQPQKQREIYQESSFAKKNLRVVVQKILNFLREISLLIFNQKKS